MNGFLNRLLSSNLDATELTNEKIRDFKRIVLAQSGIILSLLILSLFTFLAFPFHIEIAESIFFACVGIYCYTLWDTLRNYTSSRRIIVANLVFIMGVFAFGVVGVNPFYPMAPTPGYRIFLAVIQFCLLAVEASVIYFTLLEFFKKDLGLPIKLWGAAAIFLMIGLAFGSVYEIFCILQIDCLGVEVPLRTIALMKRFGFSLMVLSGMGTPYPNASELMFATGTIEALWGQIFIVLIVGRLLVK